MKRRNKARRGQLTFEWILAATLLAIGVVGGLSAVRDALIDELGDVGDAALAVDQSWSVPPDPNDPFNQDFGSYTDVNQGPIKRSR